MSTGAGHATDSDMGAEQRRAIVLLALGQGPTSGADLRDKLAVRCGDKRAVTRALSQLEAAGLVRGEKRHARLTIWHITGAGITEAMRLIAARQEARAGA